tara:strand:+ start:1182 stop:1322 length:141 start_codon:yes stop_codon:yes gene_type:complete
MNGTVFNVFCTEFNDEIYAIYEKEFKNPGFSCFDGSYFMQLHHKKV